MSKPMNIIVFISAVLASMVVLLFLPATFGDEEAMLDDNIYISSTKVAVVHAAQVETVNKEQLNVNQNTTTVSGNTDKDKVYNFLKSKDLPEVAIFALMGNFQQESQNTFMRLQGHNDNPPDQATIDFAKAIDNGTNLTWITEANGKGFGLVQWTFWTRTKALYDLAKSKGKSIADPEVQLEYLWHELKDVYGVVEYFENNPNLSLDEATTYICNNYERPGIPDLYKRKEFAKQIRDEYRGK